MFKPVKGPKEGRLPPGLLYTGPRGSSQRRFSNRQLVIGLVVSFLVIVGYFTINSDAGTISSASTVLTPASDRIAKTAGKSIPDSGRIISPADVASPKIVTGSPPKFDESKPNPYAFRPAGEATEKPLDQIYKQPANQPSIGDIEKTKQEVQKEPDVSTKQYGQTGSKAQGYSKSHSVDKADAPPVRESWSERPQFEKALATVINMLPDEVHMRELIRPVEGSGKEKMREMGLRTRAYRKYFDAWENLHMTTDSEGATYVRDDVVQYLRGQQNIKPSSLFSDDGVENLNLAQAIRSYEAYRSFLLKFANLLFPWTAPYFSDHMSLHAQIKKGGRGIVLTAGDDQAPYLLTTIYSFRQLGCTLPIEVMYLGEGDLGEDYRAELEAMPGVVTRDIAQMTNDAGWKLAGWAAKPFAILLSSFRETIFIDADSLFFRNPEVLFDDPDYVRTGALFFRDRLIMPESKKRWLQQVLPKPISKLAKESRFWTGESGHQQESGVIVVDKWKHFISMLLITRFNGPDRDGNKENGITGVYDMMYGDKETFWIGFLLAGDEGYAFHKGDAGIMGKIDSRMDEAKNKGKLNFKRDAEPEEEATHEVSEVQPEESRSEDSAQNLEGQDDSARILNAETADVDIANYEQVIPDGPLNHTICAPQLLHLDTEGKPLWFNGWLLHNKFAEKHKKRFAQFEHYLIEPREVQDPGAWQLAESNMCCLTVSEDRTFSFSAEEKKILNMIMRRAEEMGMGDQT